MGTFLTTPKMSPELALRIERRLSRRRPKTKLEEDLARPRVSLRLWLFLALASAVVLGLFVALWFTDKRELERSKQEVVAQIESKRAQLPQDFRYFLPKVQRWAVAATHDGTPDGKNEVAKDLVAVELRSKADLDAWLARKALYVHGLASDLGKAETVENAAAVSDKDAFLLCLLSPPASRTDTDVLAKVRGVNFGGAIVGDATKNVHRLQDAVVGLKFVDGSLEDRLALMRSPAVQRLATELEHVPIEAIRDAVMSELLIVVADDGPSARAILVDLVNDRLLLRIRRRMDAERATPVQKLSAAEMSGCELALDVRAAPPP